VAAGQRLNVVGVTAAHDGYERDAPTLRRRDDEGVPPAQALVAERQAAELVVAMRVDARIVEDEVGREAIEKPRQVSGEGVQVILVAETVRQTDIEVARDLADGIVPLGVDENVNRSGSCRRQSAVPSPW
jgi:hypothetical protein